MPPPTETKEVSPSKGTYSSCEKMRIMVRRFQDRVLQTRSGHARAYVECKVYSWPQEHYRNLPRCAFWREPKAAKYERIVQDDTSAEFIPQSYVIIRPYRTKKRKTTTRRYKVVMITKRSRQKRLVTPTRKSDFSSFSARVTHYDHGVSIL
jgi:hypothetical protein